MASVDPAPALQTLLDSVKTKRRSVLQAQINEAVREWSDAAHAPFWKARLKYGRDWLIPRADRNGIYEVASREAKTAADKVMNASIRAGADRDAALGYARAIYLHRLSSFMMSCFGHAPDTEQKAGDRRWLQSMEAVTQSDARRLTDRYEVLLEKHREEGPTHYDQQVRWAKQHPVFALVLAAAIPVTWLLTNGKTVATITTTIQKLTGGD